MAGTKRLRVLVVGQVPPPYHGQTIMTKVMVDQTYANAEIIHVNAGFSDSVGNTGQLSARKIARLFRIASRALVARVRQRTNVLYISPGGANPGVVFRDMFLLALLRPVSRRTVFHLHARRLPQMVDALPTPLRAVARRLYARPDYVIGASRELVDELRVFSPKHSRLIPCGIEGDERRARKAPGGPVEILFLNLVCAVKGADWLLEAFGEMRARGIDARLTLAGEVSPPEFEDQLHKRIYELGVQDDVTFAGVLVGDQKWDAIHNADIFCVPTVHPTESFGLVFIEAASCGAAIVAADIECVRDVLERDVSILLADPANRSTLTDHLMRLSADETLRASMGDAARDAFLARYTVERFRRDIDDVFADLARDI